MDGAALRRFIEERLEMHKADLARAYKAGSRIKPEWLAIAGARRSECLAILAAIERMEERQQAPTEPGRAA